MAFQRTLESKKQLKVDILVPSHQTAFFNSFISVVDSISSTSDVRQCAELFPFSPPKWLYQKGLI